MYRVRNIRLSAEFFHEWWNLPKFPETLPLSLLLYNYWKFVFLKSSILAFHFNKNHYSLTLEERYTIVPKNIQSFWRNETVESICKFHQVMVHHIHQGQCARMFITRNENLRWRFNDSRGWKTLLIHLESSNGVISCRYPLVRLHNWSRCYARLTNIHL